MQINIDQNNINFQFRGLAFDDSQTAGYALAELLDGYFGADTVQIAFDTLGLLQAFGYGGVYDDELAYEALKKKTSAALDKVING